MNGSYACELNFPNAEEADENGLVAVGGDLSTERLLLAYANGIFPWYELPYPVLWWSPDPRMVLFPEKIKISDSLRRRLKKQSCELRIDTAFGEVIHQCASSGGRSRQGTWITPEMIEAYMLLHKMGYAHSFEIWSNGTLSGGLYGVSLGKAFFGESMFHLEPDASKIALVYLAHLMQHLKFHFIDVQQETSHMQSMGAVVIPRKDFLRSLENALNYNTIKGKWTKFGCGNELLKNIMS